MTPSWFATTSEFLLVPGFMVMMIVTIAIGHWVGARAKTVSDDSSKSFSLTILGGSLGLLGLILGFTFSMAVARYEAGKSLQVSEANAVGTAFLRSKALPPQDAEIAGGLFTGYVDSLMTQSSAGLDQASYNASLRALADGQNRLWAHALQVARSKPEMVPTGLYMLALNEVIDQGGLRLNFVQYRVPEVVYLLLMATTLLTMGLAGYVSGLATTRHFWSTTVFAVVTAIVIGVIVDLDRPKRGLIRIDNARLEELKTSIDSWK